MYFVIFTKLREKEKKTKISRQLLDGKKIHQWAVSFIPALGG